MEVCAFLHPKRIVERFTCLYAFQVASGNIGWQRPVVELAWIFVILLRGSGGFTGRLLELEPALVCLVVQVLVRWEASGVVEHWINLASV